MNVLSEVTQTRLSLILNRYQQKNRSKDLNRIIKQQNKTLTPHLMETIKTKAMVKESVTRLTLILITKPTFNNRTLTFQLKLKRLLQNHSAISNSNMEVVIQAQVINRALIETHLQEELLKVDSVMLAKEELVEEIVAIKIAETDLDQV